MPIKKNMDINPSVLGMYQSIDHAIMMISQQVAHQKQTKLDRASGVMNFGQNGMMGPIELPVKHDLSAESIEQVEMA